MTEPGKYHGLYRSPLDFVAPPPAVRSLDDLVALSRVERIAHVQRIRVPHAHFVEIKEECEAVHELAGKVRRPGCLVIYGHSRSGKTTLIEEFATERPPVFRRRGANRIRVLHVTVPPYPGAKALCEQMLFALGDVEWYAGTSTQQIKRLVMLLEQSGVEIVFIDEAQHLVDMTGLVTEYGSTIFLMQVVDSVSIPFVVVGLERCRNLFRGNEMLRGRFKTAVCFDQYRFERDEERTAWVDFVNSFACSLPLRNMPDFANPKLARKMWYAALGLPGHAANIFGEAVDLVIRKTATKDTLTMEILSEAFRRTVWAETSELLDPFERGADVEEAPLPPIRTDYTAFIESRTHWKRVREEQIALTQAMKRAA